MAEYTNVSRRLIHAPDGTMMVPGMKVELSDECSDNQGFQDLVDSGDIVAGDPPSAEELQKMHEEKDAQRQAAASNAEVTANKPAVAAPAPAATVTQRPVTPQNKAQ